MQKLKLLQEEEERIEIKQKVEEEQRLKLLKEEDRMKLDLHQAKRFVQDSLRQETMRKQQVGQVGNYLEHQEISRDKDDRIRYAQHKDRPNIVKTELTTGEIPVDQIEREPVEIHYQIEPTDMHQMPIEKLERELERIFMKSYNMSSRN